MKQVGDMKVYNFEELLEEDYGKVGTPERDEFERRVDESVQAYRVVEEYKPTPDEVEAHRQLRDAFLEHSRKTMAPIIARYL